jgi:hypothetical protein
MKICILHWNMIRESVKSHNMDHLGAKSGEQAITNIQRELNAETTKDDFDPNMSHNWHWVNCALENGGLYLMGKNEDGSNDGDYCPVCEYEAHCDGWEAKVEIDKVSKSMQEFCRENGLL